MKIYKTLTIGALVLALAGALLATHFSGVITLLKPVADLPDATTTVNEPEITLVPKDKTPANFNLPKGFVLNVLAENLINPRTMMIGPDGKLWVTLTSSGQIVAIGDEDGNAQADTVTPLVKNLNKPHGLAQKCNEEGCEIFVAETDKVSVYDFVAGELKFKEILTKLGSGGRHFSRSLLFLPYPDENKLLVSIGSACDVCYEKDATRGTVQVLDLTTKTLSPFATGLRNAVFMTLHPVTGAVWATEMGRDFLGDDLPPDEVNIVKEGGFYGWPTCYGQNIHDTNFDKNTYFRNPCMEPLEIPAEIDIPAHSAPLGLTFIPEEGWGEEYWHDLLVAYHGSWNRSEPTGYKVVRYDFDLDGKLLKTEDFLTGFLGNDKKLYGRPADIMALPGGKIYLSDDKAGRVYQINYLGN